MSVKFRAIHTTRPWRKARHSTLENATHGADGAMNLLRQVGRVGRKWAEYGPVSCIFLWDDEQETGCAYRLHSGSSHDIETTNLPSHQLNRYDSAKGCSASEIASFSWRPMGLHSISASTPTVPIVADSLGDMEIPGDPINSNYPDELPIGETYPEGLAKSILINEYERSNAARRDCIQYYNPICQVCRVNFEQRYGEIGRGFIHVHHLLPVFSVGVSYRIDPIKDLRPVCPNCHAMLHRHDPPLSIDALRALLNDGSLKFR